MSIQEMQSERNRGAKWARDLSMDAVHAIIDAMVLGDFDWREWLDNRPTAVFLNAAFSEAQYREESSLAF